MKKIDYYWHVRYNVDMDIDHYDNVADQLASCLLLFQALGDSSRQNILQLLSGADRFTVGELARQTQLSRPAVSHHIKILCSAGLLSEERQGVKRYYTPTFTLAKRRLDELRSVL